MTRTIYDKVCDHSIYTSFLNVSGNFLTIKKEPQDGLLDDDEYAMC